MTNNTSTFTPSTQILEAGEKAQAIADAGKPLARFFSPEIQETVDGVQKIANALNSTGEALKHFGFDEAEPEFTNTFEDGPHPTDASQVTNWTTASLDEYEDELIGGDFAQEKIEGAKEVFESSPPKGLGDAVDIAGKVKSFVDYTQYDPANPMPTITRIQKAVNNNDTKTLNRIKLTPMTTTSQIVHEHAVRTFNDPKASAGEKFVAVAGDTFNQVDPVTNTMKSFEGLFRGIGKIFGLWDEMEPDASEGPEFRAAFSSNPETLAPTDLNSSVVTDAYQQQDAAGADLIGGQMNQGTEPYQAQDSQYAVLA